MAPHDIARAGGAPLIDRVLRHGFALIRVNPWRIVLWRMCGSRVLLVIDSTLDYSLYAGGYVGKEIETRDRLDLVHAHAIRAPVVANRS